MHWNVILDKNTRLTFHYLLKQRIGWSLILSLTQCQIAKSNGEPFNSEELLKHIAISTDKTKVVRSSSYWTNGKQDVEHEVMSCHYLRLISRSWWWPDRGHSVLKPLMHEHDNQGEFVAVSTEHFRCSMDKLSTNNGVMTEIRRQAWPEDPIINSSHCSGNEQNQALPAIHSETLPVKNNLKYYKDFYLTNVQNYFPISLRWIRFICVRRDWQIRSKHTRGSLQRSAISSNSKTTGV